MGDSNGNDNRYQHWKYWYGYTLHMFLEQLLYWMQDMELLLPCVSRCHFCSVFEQYIAQT